MWQMPGARKSPLFFNTSVIVLVFDVLLFSFLVYQSIIYFGPIDDAYISFRYARNLAWGEGLVYNSGEYAEGISNLLWTLCLAGLYRAGFNMHFAAHAVSMVCLALGALLIRAASQRVFEQRPWISRLPLLMTVSFTTFLTDAGNMLKGSALFFCCALTLYGAVRRAPLVLGVATALFTMNRPEGAVIACFIAAWTFWEFRRARISLNGFLFVAMMAVLAVGGITLFRALNFGDVIPSTVRAKALAAKIMEGNDHAATRDGIALVRNYYQPLLPLLALFAVGATRRQNISLAGLILVLLCFNAALVIKNGGDWMGFRLLSPYFALLAFGAVLGSMALPRRFCLQTAAVCVCVGTAIYNMNVEVLAHRSADFLRQPDYQARHLVQARDMAHNDVISPDKHLCPEDFYYPDDKVVVENGGMPAWTLGRAYVIEQFGLTHPALHALNHHVYAFLTVGVVNPPALFSMGPTYFIQSHFCMTLSNIPFLNEAYHADMKHFMAAIAFGAESPGRLGEIFLVRDDRATLPLFVLSYGFIAPAADLYRMPADNPELLTRWHAEPWRRDDGFEITAEWHRWDELSRVSWRIPLNPGVVRLSKPLPDAHPLLLLAALPPQSHIHGQVSASVHSPDAAAVLLKTLALEENPSESLLTCAAALAPPPHIAGAELVLEIESEYSGDILLTLYRWTADGTPAMPDSYLQHSADQQRRREALDATQDAGIDDSFHSGNMASIEQRRALLRQAMPLRHAIRKQPDSVALCRQLTNLYTDYDDKELLLKEWEVLAEALPFSPLAHAHLALARARHGDVAGTMEACADAYYASRDSLDFVLRRILAPARKFVDPAAMLQWIEEKQEKDPANPYLLACAAAIRGDITRRQAPPADGVPGKSVPLLHEASSKSPDSAALPVQQGDIAEAMAIYRRIIETVPNGYDAYEQLSDMYVRQGDLEGLVAEWQAGVAAHPNRPLAWFCLGLAHEQRNDLDAARAAYERALELDPDAEGTEEALTRVIMKQTSAEAPTAARTAGEDAAEN